MCWESRAFFFFSTLYQSNENGMMITCANVQNHWLYKDTSFQNYRKGLKHAFNSLKGCWMLPLKKGGCFQNQQLLVRISWHSYDQHVIAASSWWSQPTPGDGNWLCGAAGPELSCNSYHSDIWMVCGHESGFCDHSWHGTLCHSHSVEEIKTSPIRWSHAVSAGAGKM